MTNDVFHDTKVSRAYFQLALPLVLSLVVSLVYNLVDTYFVAQTGDTNIVAGVSLGMPVFTLLMALGNMFAQGGSSLISRLLGQQNEKEIRYVSSFCFYGALVLGAVVAALMLLFQGPMVWLLGASEETYSHAAGYYFWLAVGAPIIIVSFIHSNLLRGEGLSRQSMEGTVLGAVVNMVLDPIFISTLGMGAAGAAIATVLGYLASDLAYIVIVARKSQILSMDPRQATVPMGYVGQILGIGIPAADLPRVFEKGFTGANGRAVQSSTGLGLYLCKRLCDKLGIGLTLDSREGQGTTARLIFTVNDYITGVQG